MAVKTATTVMPAAAIRAGPSRSAMRPARGPTAAMGRASTVKATLVWIGSPPRSWNMTGSTASKAPIKTKYPKTKMSAPCSRGRPSRSSDDLRRASVRPRSAGSRATTGINSAMPAAKATKGARRPPTVTMTADIAGPATKPRTSPTMSRPRFSPAFAGFITEAALRSPGSTRPVEKPRAARLAVQAAMPSRTAIAPRAAAPSATPATAMVRPWPRSA